MSADFASKEKAKLWKTKRGFRYLDAFGEFISHLCFLICKVEIITLLLGLNETDVCYGV